MVPISFQANYIQPVEIQKYDGKEYKPCKSAFIELNNNDASVIKNLSKKWNSKLVEGIYNSFIMGYDYNHVFAVTTQADNFEKLEPDKMLGLALFEKHNKTFLHPEIRFFQVDPQNLSTQYGNTIFTKIKKFLLEILNQNKTPKKMPQYQHIGAGLIKTIQELYSKETITLFALPKAKGFYKKMGFYKSGMFMIWNKKL